ncbi:CBS domain-containing protein [Maridesulfovibrio hydrothermalis]|uniref:CBS domain containing protein n=1 Tax=Maridesulfovibrio hydrothermalis AM13 = DSM 14728 TaxID=1121451 RepID=L0RFT0_9BACT|nr:CBS domain-containing protein [Maridesulfovibrio hydrothermalis]CCO25092.1 CBS domain containing protein [Maridesulfovibrio hydrothermalis AM13 = DSM 14728]
MLVGDWMTEKVLTLPPGAPILDAVEMMRDAGIRQIPVTEASGLVVGIVSDRDVRDAMPSKFLPGDNTAKGEGLLGLKIKDIMTHDPYIVSPETCMEVAAETLLENKIGGLPVVDDLGLVGIITEVDIYRFLTTVTGVGRGSSQFAFILEDTASALEDLLSDLWARGVRLSTVFTSYEGVEQGQRRVFIWVQRQDDSAVDSLVMHLKRTYNLKYHVHRGETYKTEF